MPTSHSTRLRPPVGSDGPRVVIDQRNYLPIFFTSIANTWSRGASKVFLGRYGVGFLDWVVVSMMAVEPGTSAFRICQNTALNKAAVSRCLAELEAKRLVVGTAAGRDTRKRTFELTDAGYDLHDQLMAIAVRRENQLLDGLSADDVAVLFGLLGRVKANLLTIQERDAAALEGDADTVW